MTPLNQDTSTPEDRTQQQTAQQAAQNTLVNTTIKLGVQALYSSAVQSRWEIKTTIRANDGGDIFLGATQEDVFKYLCDIPSEFERVRTFNLLAKENAFNLSIKTAGPKSPESTTRKASTKSYNNKPLGDAVRVSVVSSYPDQLDWMSEQLQKELTSEAHRVEGLTQEIEDWEMSGNALLRKVLKNNVDGFGAEVQFLPREQSRMAARITHHFFKVIRLYDDVRATFEDASPEVKQSLNAEPGQVKIFPGSEAHAVGEKIVICSEKMFDTYSKVANFINRLCSNETMRDTDREEFNALLRNIDASPQTYDDVSEGGQQAGQPYSPIFKTMKDIKSYRAYMKEKGVEIGKEKGAKTKLFPLPEITQNSSPEDVEKAMWALKKCSQLTHACYMNDAEEPMRNLWVAEARKMNANLPEERRIPDCAINCVNHSLDKNPAPVQGAARAR